MPALGAFFAYFIGSSLTTIVFRVVAALGLGVVSYGGTSFILDQLVSLFISYSTALPPDFFGVLGYLWFDRAFSVVVSSFGIAIAIKVARKTITVRSGS